MIYSCFFTQNIYVSANGNDANNGTKDNPIYSLQAALDIAIKNEKNPVIINVDSGDYFVDKPLILDSKHTRNSSNKIQIIGNSKNIPVFFGGKKTKPILNPNTKYWEIDLSQFNVPDGVMNFITVNGVARSYSKYPKHGFITIPQVDYKDNTIIIKIPSELNEILNQSSQAGVKNTIITVYVKWTNLIKYIDVHDYSSSSIIIKNISLPDVYKIIPNETLFKINNIKKNLEEGEWYLENKKIIYNPVSSEDPSSSIVVVPAINQFLIGNGNVNNKLSYIEFRNLSFNTVGSGLKKDGYFPYQAAVEVPAAFDLKYSSNLKFKNLKFKNFSNYTFWFQEGCENINISDSDFSDLGAGAVKIGNINYSSETNTVNNIIFDNNIIKKGGLLYNDAVPVNIINAFSNTISHNDISDFSYTGISVGWVWGYGKSLSKNNMISYNHIYDIGKGTLDDMGGIYTLGVSNGTVIKNNVIHDVNSKNYGGWGIYTDEGSSNILIENNLVYNCKSSGFHQHFGENNIIRNNIFAFNGLAELQATRIEDHNSFDFKNNIIVHHNNNFFASNWLNVKKNSINNIYYSTDGKNTIILPELSGLHIDPGLKKKDNYYKITNKSAAKKINFKMIDFSKTGIY